ncbi:hypothetical protein FB451DRAFT_1188177 [Mycena latifolia]|nr:hypothetical protein FB451DRAFT_1188177 [Mycena latifolia]
MALTLPHLIELTFQSEGSPLTPVFWPHTAVLDLAVRSSFHNHLQSRHLSQVVVTESELVESLSALPLLQHLLIAGHQVFERIFKVLALAPPAGTGVTAVPQQVVLDARLSSGTRLECGRAAARVVYPKITCMRVLARGTLASMRWTHILIPSCIRLSDVRIDQHIRLASVITTDPSAASSCLDGSSELDKQHFVGISTNVTIGSTIQCLAISRNQEAVHKRENLSQKTHSSPALHRSVPYRTGSDRKTQRISPCQHTQKSRGDIAFLGAKFGQAIIRVLAGRSPDQVVKGADMQRLEGLDGVAVSLECQNGERQLIRVLWSPSLPSFPSNRVYIRAIALIFSLMCMALAIPSHGWVHGARLMAQQVLNSKMNSTYED